MRARWLIVVAAFVGALIWLWRSAQDDPPAAKPSAPETAPVARGQRTTIIPSAPPQRLTLPPRVVAFDATSHHTADPCTALAEPVVPATFETITAAGITIAWDPAEIVGPYDTALRPVTLAYTVAGLLEEAAQLTGTERRPQLTVIVSATKEDLTERTKLPAWVGGLYDGGAVHVVASARADLGVNLMTLRHELMHAQVHAGIGCVPFWFNEGLANYFAGWTSPGQWMAMLREPPFDIATLRDPYIFDLKVENVSRMYAVSTAMVLYIVHRGGEVALRETVRVAQSASTIPDAHDLWNRALPNVGYAAILEMFATKTFGIAPGPELDAVLAGPVCCRNLRTPAELSCHAATAADMDRAKVLADTPRREMCRPRWY